MQRVILILAGGCLGLLLGLLLFGREAAEPPHLSHSAATPSEPSSTGRRDSDAEAIASLREQLAHETARAEVLAEEVRLLRPRQGEVEVAAEGEPERAPEEIAPPVEAGEAQPAVKGRGSWLDEQALLAAGFHPSEIDDLRARFEEIELERLYLRDDATRQGYVNKPRFRQELAKLNERYVALRGDFSDDDYDWVLYASGSTNRVVATIVMQGSPAEAAGIEPGDVFVAYGDRRIFGMPELQQATKTLGTTGETIAVDVLRDSRELRFYVPVGPLGVQLTAVKQKPSNTR